MLDAINHCDNTKKICEPLFNHLPIQHFSYGQVNDKGEFFRVGTDQTLLKKQINEKFYEYMPIGMLAQFPAQGHYLRDIQYKNESRSIILNHKRLVESYGYGHSLMIVKRQEIDNSATLKFYCFDASLHNNEINHHYVKYIPLIDKFIKYFDHQIGAFKIEPSIIERNYFDNFKEMLRYSNQLNEKLDIANNRFLNAISLPNFIQKLTRREMEILSLYADGRTAKETADFLNISFRTVENLFEKAKAKMQCHSKLEAVLKFKNMTE